MTPSVVRVGAVSYLNTLPLLAGLDEAVARGEVALSADVPATLAERTANGELDVSLLPVIELARIPGLEVVPGLSISTSGESLSVLVVSKCPFEEIRTLASDPESRTSNALATVLVAMRCGTPPQLLRGSLDLGASLRQADAAVRIGDKALFDPLPAEAQVYDLGTLWTEATGLPFVFAVWAARPGVVDRSLYRLLHRSRRRGSETLAAIAGEFRWNGVRHPDLVERYLTSHIRYRLGGTEVRALETFFRAASDCGVIESQPQLRFALDRPTRCDEMVNR